jgi:hypothetical protein
MAETLSVTDMLPNKFEPKRTSRWVLQIEGIDAFLIKQTARPSMKFQTIKIPFINSKRYVSGGFEFDEMKLTLHDPIAPSGAQQVMEWIRTHFESVSGRAGYADFYKRDIQLKLLDPVGTVIELWDVKGALIVTVSYGDLSYEEDNKINEITLSLRYDNAVLQF